MFWERWLLVALLSSVSCFFCFSKIFSSVWMLRFSSIPFFVPTFDYSKVLVEVSLADPGFCFCWSFFLL
ncbi:hypothetical protein Hanom_Chr11g01021801 [Helianthus anomalus]